MPPELSLPRQAETNLTPTILDFASASKTPQIRSQLIEGGTSFEEAFVGLSLCCPSRATILTGLYAHNHGVTHNEPLGGGFEVFHSKGLEENTIANRLQEVGYQTAYFGKYLNGYPGDEESTYIPPGWNKWYGKDGYREHQPYRYKINENGQVISYGNSTENYYSDILSKQATDYVRSTAENSRPFFMFVAPTAPHGPATPAERHKGTFANSSRSLPPVFSRVQPMRRSNLLTVDSLTPSLATLRRYSRLCAKVAPRWRRAAPAGPLPRASSRVRLPSGVCLGYSSGAAILLPGPS
jgi:arylsulfatase A-like enzyme